MFLRVIVLVALLNSIKGEIFANDKRFIQIDYLSLCPVPKENADAGLSMNLSYHHYNRTNKVLDYNITMPDLFDEKYSVDVTGWKWGDGGWKKNAFRFRQKYACRSLHVFFEDLWFDILEYSNTPGNISCPLQPGTYYGNDFYLDTSRFRKPFMIGKFRVFTKIFRWNKLAFCVVFQAILNRSV